MVLIQNKQLRKKTTKKKRRKKLKIQTIMANSIIQQNLIQTKPHQKVKHKYQIFANRIYKEFNLFYSIITKAYPVGPGIINSIIPQIFQMYLIIYQIKISRATLQNKYFLKQETLILHINNFLEYCMILTMICCLKVSNGCFQINKKVP